MKRNTQIRKRILAFVLAIAMAFSTNLAGYSATTVFASEEGTYTNLVDMKGNPKVVYDEDDLYFSLTAPLDKAMYGYSIEQYYGWYGPNTGYTYFVDDQGNDIYQKLSELVGDQEYVPVSDELIYWIRELSASWYGNSIYADYYYYFLQIPSDLVAEGNEEDETDEESVSWEYIADQYTNLADANTGEALADYSQDNYGNLYFSLTESLSFACSDYALADYYDYYGASYFLDAEGNNIYEALAEIQGDHRFVQVDEIVVSYLKSLSLRWGYGADNWYLFAFFDTGYDELYNNDGETNENLAMKEELYVNVHRPLQYILFDSDGEYGSKAEAPVSLEEAYSLSGWSDLLTDKESGANLYEELVAEIGDTEDAYGFAPVTDEMIPILKKLAYNRWASYGDYSEYWDCYCFYKKCDVTELENPYVNDEKVGSVELIFGNEELADEDAYILTLFGDGFTAEEEEEFYQHAKELAEYMMTTSPFTDLTAAIKIYAVATVSEESGISNEDVKNANDVGKAQYLKDTYFSASYWGYQTQRLVILPKEGQLRLSSLSRFLVPETDISGVIVNSAVYGGAGGSYLTTSLEASAPEIFIHEFGHTCADLADEYYAGSDYEMEKANMTKESDSENIKWSKFIGIDGCGIYPYKDYYGNETGWYRPSQTCKMQYLGTKYPFCPVCSEQIRKSVCKASNVGILFFQPYNKTSFSSLEELEAAFILRQTAGETTLDQLDQSLLSFQFVDEDDNSYDNYPRKSGDYRVTVSFAGNDSYDACALTSKVSLMAVEVDADEDFVDDDKKDAVDDDKKDAVDDDKKDSLDDDKKDSVDDGKKDSVDDDKKDSLSDGVKAETDLDEDVLGTRKDETTEQVNGPSPAESPKEEKNPVTGDGSDFYAWMLLMMAGASLAVLSFKKNRIENN